MILSQSSIPFPPRQLCPPSALRNPHSPFLGFITSTLFKGTPHSLAALIATSFASSLQKIRLLFPCLTCLLNSEDVKAALAALYTPPAAMTPKSTIGRRIWPEEMQTTTSFPEPFAPMPKLCLKLYAAFLVKSRAWDLVIVLEASEASTWRTVSSFAPQRGESIMT